MHDFPDDDPAPAHREFTLSTPLILLLFMVLAIVCGVFFGLGYRAHTAKQAANMQVQPDAASASSHATFLGFKPPAGSPTGVSQGRTSPAAVTPPATATHAMNADSESAAPIVHTPATSVSSPQPPMSTGSFVVQLAAISAAHAEDADMLVSALRAKGYTVAAHKEADSLLHVQVGPFTNRKDAEIMRQKLEADGYKPFIK